MVYLRKKGKQYQKLEDTRYILNILLPHPAILPYFSWEAGSQLYIVKHFLYAHSFQEKFHSGRIIFSIYRIWGRFFSSLSALTEPVSSSPILTNTAGTLNLIMHLLRIYCIIFCKNKFQLTSIYFIYRIIMILWFSICFHILAHGKKLNCLN